ncbi:unnamed protein product [Soboliphyme baturini]|uniref:WD_REPEATS_REGION domain-containing protein n=1 Tax=Soboliphyme baturini TaxID=241478 RepID=A0A183I9K2_9BILA|nr:unnamed protein product [Soboliphyme baturini]
MMLFSKDGSLLLFDIGSRTLLQTVEAHNGPVSTIELFPHQDGIATGGADKVVKFWTFEVDASVATKLVLSLSTALDTDENVTCFKFTSDGKYIILGMLDNTAKIFFADTFKVWLVTSDAVKIVINVEFNVKHF